MRKPKIAPTDMSRLRVIAYLKSRGATEYAKEISEVLKGNDARHVADFLVTGTKTPSKTLEEFAEGLRGSVDIGPKSARWYIERAKNGSYQVRKGGAHRASATSETQSEAISRAREMDPHAPILVERLRATTAKSRDKWRKP